MIYDVPRETATITTAFLYVVRCSLFFLFRNCCSQQQNRNSVVCADFLQAFYLGSVFCAATSASGRRKSRNLSSCMQRQTVYHLVLLAKETEKKQRLETTELMWGRRQPKEILWVHSGLISKAASFAWFIINLGQLKGKMDYKHV